MTPTQKQIDHTGHHFEAVSSCHEDYEIISNGEFWQVVENGKLAMPYDSFKTFSEAVRWIG